MSASNVRKTCTNAAVQGGILADKLPMEMLFKIFSYLNLATVREVRLVSKRWKVLAEASKKVHFVCHLTDETVLTAVNSTEVFNYVKIYDFTGVGNRVISATRGTGRLFARVESVHLIGESIDATEMNKMIKYAVGTMKELLFKACQTDILLKVFTARRSFTSLRKLTICYQNFPSKSHTKIFERLASTETRVGLPSLEYFNLSYELERVDELYNMVHIPTPNEVFANYLAIARVVVRFRSTLKYVEIARNEVLRTALVLQVDTSQVTLTVQERVAIQDCLNYFDDMNLDVLHITPLLDEGQYPWILETTLFRRQKDLKEAYVNKKLCAPRLGSQALETILPNNCASFTSIKIALTCMGNAPVDLAPFSQCPNLKTLWLAFYRGVRIGPARQNSLHFTNLEMIPKTITSFHLKSSQQDTIIIHQQSILSREQLRWVIENLLELESLWMQLVAEESDEDLDAYLPRQLIEPVHQQRVPHANVQVDNNLIAVPEAAAAFPDQEAQEAHQLLNRLNQELNANANVNTETFREMISMPKIKEMKFDMLKAGQLGSILELGADGNPWILPMGIHVSLEDIREYTGICEAAANITFSTQTTSFFPFGFIELTVTRT